MPVCDWPSGGSRALLLVAACWLNTGALSAAGFNVKDYGATGDGRTLDTDSINKAILSEGFKDKFAKIGDEGGGGSPEDFAAVIKSDSAKWGDVISRSGVKLD